MKLALDENLPPSLARAAHALLQPEGGQAFSIPDRFGRGFADIDWIAALRPQPGAFPVLDVASLQRRAEIERKKLRAMVDYAYNPRCRRQLILEYFGDEDWANRDRK